MKRSRSLAPALLPAAVLFLGWAGNAVLQPTRVMNLEEPLSGFPDQLGGYVMSSEDKLSDAEVSVLAPDSYLLRRYADDNGREWDLYLAFYGLQASGSSIHSPRNCLPGSGWEPVLHERVVVESALGFGSINRYVVEHQSGARSLVYYWYQGRGRIEANEYRVKWDLVRDAIVKRRTDETLVRIVFPLRKGEKVEAVEDRDLLALVADALQPHLPG